MVGQLTVTVTIEYTGATVTIRANERSDNPLFAAMVAEQAVVAAGQRAVDMLAAAHGDTRRSDPAKRLDDANWPLGPRPTPGWRS